MGVNYTSTQQPATHNCRPAQICNFRLHGGATSGSVIASKTRRQIMDRFNAWWDRHETTLNIIAAVIVFIAVMYVW